MYVADATINEDVFFCAPVKGRATKERFKIVIFMKGKSIKLKTVLEYAQMAGYKGLHALSK